MRASTSHSVAGLLVVLSAARMAHAADPVATPSTEPAPVSTPPKAGQAAPAEVTVSGAPTDAKRLQQSAEAVNVVDTRKAKEGAADLGEVLARTQGVAVRRDGGLGSGTRFSLNGLQDDQIRFFLDGVPLELAGFPFGIANVPVNLVDRVEIYRGVVPIRFGADALGGAVNLVSNPRYDTRASASYQVGSFGTRRITLDGRWRHEPTGIVLGASGFFDSAKNDYDVDVEIPGPDGRPRPARVPRFHDAYRARGVSVEAGVVDRPWARRLLLRGFYSSYDKELQHDATMSRAFGEVTSGEAVSGVTGRYEVALHPRVDLELVGSYAHRTIDFLDVSPRVWGWNARPTSEPGTRGEIERKPYDQTVWQNSVYGRGLVKWAIAPHHALRASFTPSFATRTGENRAHVGSRDPLTADSNLFTFVSGLEYELNAVGDRLQTILFAKDYYYNAKSEEPVLGDVFRPRDTEHHSQGAGASLRYRFTPWLYAKASYEYATRLPRPDEVFGDGVLIRPNLGLEPEVSHNVNMGPRFELRRTKFGDLTFDVNAFLRESDRLIVRLAGQGFFLYENVYKARTLGLENALNWSSPGRFVSVDGALTWLDQRNASSEGKFGNFEGDRIADRPYLFGSWGARLRFTGLPDKRDTIEPFYYGRWVHGFFVGWESNGLPNSKQKVDAQLTHNVGVSWTVSRDAARITSTFEIDNATDAKVFDNYGVQRPGRAVYLKVSAELR